MQPNIIVFTWAGVGFATLFQGLAKRSLIAGQASAYLLCPSIAGIGISVQMGTWYDFSDHHRNQHIEKYARALAAPIPPDSLYLVNYDHQWTSLRYLHRCEGFRPDITFINLSMMTFKWLETKHSTFSKINFPNGYLVPYGSEGHIKGEGFTIADLIEANIDRFAGGIYIGGKLSFDEMLARKKFDFVSHGMVNRIVPNAESDALTIRQWSKLSDKAWKMVDKRILPLPNETKYTEETWEWTVARDYHMKLDERATYLLDKAVGGREEGTMASLLKCINWYETIVLHEPDKFIPTRTLKNLGLAYAHVIRSKESVPPGMKQILHPDMEALYDTELPWKDKAAKRWHFIWSSFLQRPDSKSDSSYEQIKGIISNVEKKSPK